MSSVTKTKVTPETHANHVHLTVFFMLFNLYNLILGIHVSTVMRVVHT